MSDEKNLSNDIVKQSDMIAVDTLSNLVAGLGTRRDKRSGYKFSRSRSNLTFDSETLLALYEEEWSAAKIVDIIPDEMVREWRTFNIAGDLSQVKAIEREEKRLSIRKKTNLALKWARLFGGSTFLLNVRNQTDLRQPLDINRIGKGDLIDINVVERPLVNVDIEDFNFFNPTSITFNDPEFFRFVNSTQLVHASHVIVFKGVAVPKFFAGSANNSFWGDSVLNRAFDSILNNTALNNAVSTMVTEANIDVIGVTNLSGTLSGEAGTAALQKRFELANLLKSITQTYIMDASEKFERKAISFSGLPEIMGMFLKILSAVTDIPATRFLGESASGLSDTGEHDLRNYYDMVAAKQEIDLRPSLDKLDEVLIRSALGEFPDDLVYDFVPLWQLDPTQKAQIKSLNATSDIQYLNNNIITPAMILKNLKKENIYDITDDDIEQLEEATSFEFDENETAKTRIEPESEEEPEIPPESEIPEDITPPLSPLVPVETSDGNTTPTNES